MKKICCILVLLLLASMLVEGSNFQPAKAGASSQAGLGQAADTDWWPMFHHDLTHSGNSTSTGPKKPYHVVWNYTTGGVVESSPAVANGVVYVGDHNGDVYALNATTGLLIPGKYWPYQTGGPVRSSPAVANGIVYVGSEDGNISALNATTGSCKWFDALPGGVDSSPAVANGIVYVGSNDGDIYAYNASTGTARWSPQYTGGPVDSSPAVANGKVYVGSDDGKVCAYTSTLTSIWNYTTNGSIGYSSPAVANGIVYVGSEDDNVYALNAINGTKIWNYRTLYPVESSPAVANGIVYVGSDNGKVYALNAINGTLIWNYTTGGEVISSPAVAANGIVYVGSENNKVYALNATAGALIWNYTTGNSVISSPAVAGSRVYVGSDDGIIYDFGPLQLTVAISPGSATLNVGQSQLFMSSVEGGISPYTYQWYLKGATISGATNTTWRFTPASPGSYAVYVVVNDSATPPASAQCSKASVTVLSPTIYIMNNGSVVPSYAPISSLDKVTYTLTGNISYPTYYGIAVERSNIVIDGKGYTLQGNKSGTGISLTGISNVTIKNTKIKRFDFGIYLNSSSDNTISGNNITANSYDGIGLFSSSGNTLSGNNVTANSNDGIDLQSSSGNVLSANNVTANSYDGIYLSSSYNNILSGNNVTANSACGVELVSSSGNALSGNNVTANGWGIFLFSSSGNALSGNVIAGSTSSFGLYGSVLSDFVNYVDTSNLVNGKPIYYLMNRSNIVISPTTYPEGVGYLALINCVNVTVQGLTLTKNVQGLLLANTTDSKITDNNASANSGYGIWLFSSSGNALSGNNVTANGTFGIDLNSSSDNNITANKIANNDWNLGLENASNNIIYHNSFERLENGYQVLIDVKSIGNAWNDTYPAGGNYWSDYKGVDLKRGPYQNLTGSDGIGDTPYVIYPNNIDHYPLMKPYGGPYDIGITNVTTLKTAVAQGFNLNLSVKVVNYGISSETFNATVYANTNVIATLTNITLTSRNSTTIPFTWNTTGFALGTYTISANVTRVPGQTDLANNSARARGSVQITKVGDLGSRVPTGPTTYTNEFGVFDGSVGSDDLSLFLECYHGTAPAQWMYLADLGSRVEVSPGVYENEFFKCDGLVNTADLTLFLLCYHGLGPN